MSSVILAGDVGGTKTRLAMYSSDGDKLTRLTVERFESAKFKTLDDIINTFISQQKAQPAQACFGVPGPVINGSVKITNLPWALNEQELSKRINVPKVLLVNDLVATAAAIPHFEANDLEVLHQGQVAQGDGISLVIAPGTGMGQACLVKRDGKYFSLPSEGGHANFSPSNKLEFELHAYLEKRLGHVSVESVLCGPGLLNIYNFLRDTHYADEPEELKNMLAQDNPAAVITATAQQERFELTVKALDMFVSMLGAHSSNVMLTVLAFHGVYLGGGVPPKIIKKLLDGTILKSYLHKGKMVKQVEQTSLYVIKDDHAALTGAAYLASQISSSD